ncbi:MAG: tetratricopeptide repeat protein [Sulfuricaulis sp.]|uniref:tetratricopeptide repeat protein n=1 Tax=Sulfuricaulis sp. TaxID=2003553 RepID=UPI0034A2D1F1
MKRWILSWAVISAALALAGCVSSAPRLTPQQEAAIEYNQRGEAAFRQGEFALARDEYQKSLAIHRSVENQEGVARELMNLSLVYRRLGNPSDAHAALDQILSGPGLPFDDKQRAEAAYRKASFYLDDADAANARIWASKALDLCRGCPAEGRIYNLKARMSLPANLNESLQLARRALALNRSAGNKSEEANSQRLIADAAFQTGDYASAQAAYAAALQLDKETGAPEKIALDLMGLGRSFARQGKRNEAKEYFQRAYLVSEGVGDVQAMSEAAAELKKLAP